MIYYLVSKKHTYTVKRWIKHYPEQLMGRLRVLPYSKCHGTVQEGTFIFSDIDRLSPRATRKASRLLDKVRRAGCRTLNHPSDSLRRYDLQKSLRNDFRVFRSHEVPADLRYPVFLRVENDHGGSQTDLLRDPESYHAARQQFPDSLVVEFLDTRDENGLFRKYSAFRIGERIIPRHVLFSRDWVVKKSDVIDDATARVEFEYLEDHPHEADLRGIFDVAKIDFGRIDYGIHEGRIQTWEINSNPSLTAPRRGRPSETYLKRLAVHEWGARATNEALLELDVGRESKKVRLGIPRTWRPESRFAI
ncbi:MAG: hypothetical protein JRG76_18580 [Deltaproteobacteria bacterium]|nr:hypothetical protein [Deltaproteobacteria bacterium]